MAQKNKYQFSNEERKLFANIAAHIQANPNDYKQAGKWLDEFCSESAYWSRRKDELEKLKKSRDTLPEDLYQRDVDRLEKEIAEKRTLLINIRFDEAKKYFSDKSKDLELVSKDEAKKIILITWLITDPDAENAKLKITEFENWMWKSQVDHIAQSREYKSFLFSQNKVLWVRLANIAWEKVSNNQEESILKPKPPEFLQKLLWVIRYGKKHWKLILIAIILLGIITSLRYNLHNKIFNLLKESSITSEDRTPLYPRTQKRVYDICDKIEEEKLNPWLFINIDKMRPVTMHNGKVISYRGVLYEGAPRLIFWSDDFIPPFIEDAIVQVFDETIEECRKNNLDPKPYIDEANSILFGFIIHIYSRMADIDQKLSSAVDSKKAGRRDVSDEVEEMRRCLKEHYDAAILLSSRNENTSVNLKD